MEGSWQRLTVLWPVSGHFGPEMGWKEEWGARRVHPQNLSAGFRRQGNSFSGNWWVILARAWPDLNFEDTDKSLEEQDTLSPKVWFPRKYMQKTVSPALKLLGSAQVSYRSGL